MATIEDSVIRTAEWLTDAAGRVHQAIRNVGEIQPGYSSSTPGNGSPGGGSGFSPTSIVERSVGRELKVRSHELVNFAGEIVATVLDRDAHGNVVIEGSIEDDMAARDLIRMRVLAAELEPRAREFADLCSRWDYRRAGDHVTSSASVRKTMPTERPESQLKWCVSHVRIHQAEPVYKARKMEGYDESLPLCRKCYEFAAAEGFLPTIPILDLWAQGRKLTEPVVAKVRLSERAKAAAKAKAARQAAKASRKKNRP